MWTLAADGGAEHSGPNAKGRAGEAAPSPTTDTLGAKLAFSRGHACPRDQPTTTGLASSWAAPIFSPGCRSHLLLSRPTPKPRGGRGRSGMNGWSRTPRVPHPQPCWGGQSLCWARADPRPSAPHAVLCPDTELPPPGTRLAAGKVPAHHTGVASGGVFRPQVSLLLSAAGLQVTPESQARWGGGRERFSLLHNPADRTLRGGTQG